MYLATGLLILYVVMAGVFEGFCRATDKKWPKDFNFILILLFCLYAAHFVGYGQTLFGELPASKAYVAAFVLIFFGIGSFCSLFLATAFSTAFIMLGNKDGAKFCLLFWGWLFLAFTPVPSFFPNCLTVFVFKATGF
jgi:hypothetical protein